MALKVQVTRPRAARVQITPAEQLQVDVARFKMEPVNLEDLKNVDKTTNGLDTGQVVVYDEVTKKWVTQQPEASDLDGGFY